MKATLTNSKILNLTLTALITFSLSACGTKAREAKIAAMEAEANPPKEEKKVVPSDPAKAAEEIAANLKSEKEKALTELKTKSEALEAEKKKSKEAQDQLALGKGILEKAKTDLEDANKAHETTKEELKTAKTELDAAKANEADPAKIAELEGKVAKLEGEAKTANEASEKATKDLEEANGKVKTAEEAAKAAEEQVKIAEGKAKAAEDKVAELEKAKKDAEDALAEKIEEEKAANHCNTVPEELSKEPSQKLTNEQLKDMKDSYELVSVQYYQSSINSYKQESVWSKVDLEQKNEKLQVTETVLCRNNAHTVWTATVQFHFQIVLSDFAEEYKTNAESKPIQRTLDKDEKLFTYNLIIRSDTAENEAKILSLEANERLVSYIEDNGKGDDAWSGYGDDTAEDADNYAVSGSIYKISDSEIEIRISSSGSYVSAARYKLKAEAPVIPAN